MPLYTPMHLNLSFTAAHHGSSHQDWRLASAGTSIGGAHDASADLSAHIHTYTHTHTHTHCCARMSGRTHTLQTERLIILRPWFTPSWLRLKASLRPMLKSLERSLQKVLVCASVIVVSTAKFLRRTSLKSSAHVGARQAH